MSLWNAANGPSIHAELLARELIRYGHEIIVFAPKRHPDARPTNQVDEQFVIRNYSVYKVSPVTMADFFDPDPLFKEDYDVFVAENVERLPTHILIEIFPKIREKAVTVNVVHEGGPPSDPLYYMFDWDAIVCFDHRYVEWVSKYFPRDRIHIIPYPCHPFRPGDKYESRRELNLPLDKKIIFTFGFRIHDITPVLPTIEKVSRKIPLIYLLIANPGGDVESIKHLLRKYEFVYLRVDALPLDKLYKYLYAADAHLIHRESNKKYKCVLSSTVCLTLGSGCPILFHESNYVELHGDEIIKYRDMDDLERKLIDVLTHGYDIDKVRKFLMRRSSEVIAKKYIELFNELLSIRS